MYMHVHVALCCKYFPIEVVRLWFIVAAKIIMCSTIIALKNCYSIHKTYIIIIIHATTALAEDFAPQVTVLNP